MLSDDHWNLIDSLLCEMDKHKGTGEGWFNISEETRAAFNAMWKELDRLTSTKETA